MSKIDSKIMILVPSLGMGGTERMVALLSTGFTKKGVETVVVLMSDNTPFYQLSKNVKLKVPTNLSKNKFFRVYQAISYLRKQIKLEKPNAVLCMGYMLYGLLSVLFLDVKFFLSWRRSPFRKRFKSNFLLQFLYDVSHRVLSRRVDGLIAQTSVARNFYKNKYKCKIEVIPNSIKVLESSVDLNREKIILNVGRFIESKKQKFLIEYFCKLDNSGWSLSFLGDGENLNEAMILASSVDKRNDISFHGKVENVNSWYDRSSIFAFTSVSEGFPNALAEAMAHGCACISFDCIAGPADIIDDGVNGFLIPEGNHELYQEKLALFMQDEALRIRFGKAAVVKMRQFEMTKITERFLDFML